MFFYKILLFLDIKYTFKRFKKGLSDNLKLKTNIKVGFTKKYKRI